MKKSLSFAALLLAAQSQACRPAGSTSAGLKDEGVADSVATEGGCLAALPSLAQYDWIEDTGKEELAKVFEACLGEYIRIKTVNPPGNEDQATAFLGKMFEAMGVPYRVVTVTDDATGAQRSNLIAGWPALRDPNATGAAGRGIVLMNHMDVVHAEAEEWRKIEGAPDAPFSGAITEIDGEKVIFGRGAIDMKDIGIMQALTLGLMKLRNVTPPVPVYFVATADEENDAIGIRGLMKEALPGGKAPELREPFVVLNEGGFGIRGALGTASTLHAIGTEERGGAWLEVSAKDATTAFKTLAALSITPTTKDVAATRLKHKAKADAAACKIESASTEKTKANVVPSRAKMRFTCSADLDDALLKDAFDPTPLWEKRKSAWRASGPATPVKVEVTRPVAGVIEVALSTATTGHGSSFAGISALDAMAYGAQALGAVPPLTSPSLPKAFAYKLTPASRRLLSTAAKHHDLLGGIVPAVENLDQYLDKIDTMLGQKAFDALASRFGIDKLFRTACTWTGFDAQAAGAAKLTLDCRLIDLEPTGPGKPSHPETFVKALKAHFAAQSLAGVDIKTLTGWNFTSSPVDGPYYKAIADTVEKSFAGSIATPFMIPGGTDSTYTRDPSSLGLTALAGVPSYGVTPAIVTVDVVSTFHGSNERFPVSQFAPSVRAYVKMVMKLAAVAAAP